MTSSTSSCRYCGADVSPSQQRCRECESWLSWRAFLTYPDTIWSQVAVLLSVVAAVVAWMHALEVRAERRAAEDLRVEVNAVASRVTRMAAVISDGASQGDALPDSHVEQISTGNAGPDPASAHHVQCRSGPHAGRSEAEARSGAVRPLT